MREEGGDIRIYVASHVSRDYRLDYRLLLSEKKRGECEEREGESTPS